MLLTSEKSLKWWIEYVDAPKKRVSPRVANAVLYTDASNPMWGAYDETHNQKTNGFWSTEENETCVFSYIRTKIKEFQNTLKPSIIINSWRTSTRKQYTTYLKQWFHFCNGKTNFVALNTNYVLEFLTLLFDKGLSYSAICIARSSTNTLHKTVSNIDLNNNSLIAMVQCYMGRWHCIKLSSKNEYTIPSTVIL